ncbi:hypothetical protein [Rhodohalobacter barkolensis]|uniref:Uncharacterized protein n=1 Tax=Rhodohalobacter barkolensis TaxID=2053187 RepID=A0A2N0VHR3_9BACT|nr:hypothetical protein [Rhodohalobacter barkolensis]PKD43730.1 hypothetical protein CWD77_09225 [Rhodohalobacter barkolensis]
MTPINNLYKVLSELEAVNAEECRDVMSDYDSYVDDIQKKIYIQTFMIQYNNAKKYYRKGNKTGEKRSLIFAINVIQSNDSLTMELRNKNVRDYVTGTRLTPGKIAKRLNELDGVKLT